MRFEPSPAPLFKLKSGQKKKTSLPHRSHGSLKQVQAHLCKFCMPRALKLAALSEELLFELGITSFCSALRSHSAWGMRHCPCSHFLGLYCYCVGSLDFGILLVFPFKQQTVEHFLLGDPLTSTQGGARVFPVFSQELTRHTYFLLPLCVDVALQRLGAEAWAPAQSFPLTPDEAEPLVDSDWGVSKLLVGIQTTFGGNIFRRMGRVY